MWFHILELPLQLRQQTTCQYDNFFSKVNCRHSGIGAWELVCSSVMLVFNIPYEHPDALTLRSVSVQSPRLGMGGT